MTAAPETVEPTTSEVLRIGELAQRTGVTARTLRYWEELGLIRPSGHRGGGERLYLPTDMARVTRIKDLQDLLGFSLAEVRAVLETEDVDALDRARSELRWGETTPERRRQLYVDAAAANERLLEHLDHTLIRIQAFRDERAATAALLARRLAELDDRPQPEEE